LPIPRVTPVGDDLAEGTDTVVQCQEELGHELARHGKLIHLMRNQLVDSTPAGLDFAAFTVLMMLVKGGPTRQGELAETALLDPSTVSRHVAQLVKAGLLERRADPGDGRAIQLVAAPEGLALAKQFMLARRRLMQQVMAGWSLEDSATLVSLMRRLNDDLEALRPQ
jgi:DNA-binding MarR family transcriptional regulator